MSASAAARHFPRRAAHMQKSRTPLPPHPPQTNPPPPPIPAPTRRTPQRRHIPPIRARKILPSQPQQRLQLPLEDQPSELVLPQLTGRILPQAPPVRHPRSNLPRRRPYFLMIPQPP